MKQECSFCGTPLAKQVPGAPTLVVAGPRVYICRDCVGLCIEIMAESDPAWREQKLETLTSLRSGEI
jgi:ATP-dependent protease Clp ATPase subunit